MRNYDKEFLDNKHKKYAYEFDDVLRDYMLKSFLKFKPNDTVLELGSYKGGFTKKLLNFFSDITVIEASSELSKLTEKNTNHSVKVITSTFETARLTEKYNTIFCIHTLEHLDDPVIVLNKISDWLTDDGLLFLAVPNANAPSRQIAVKMGLIKHNTAITPGEKEHGHRFTFTLDTLQEQVNKSTLNIMHSGGVFFKPFANFQFDQLMNQSIINQDYLDGCYELGAHYPDLCASIFLVCKK